MLSSRIPSGYVYSLAVVYRYSPVYTRGGLVKLL